MPLDVLGNLTLDEALRLGRERSHPLRASQVTGEQVGGAAGHVIHQQHNGTVVLPRAGGVQDNVAAFEVFMAGTILDVAGAARGGFLEQPAGNVRVAVAATIVTNVEDNARGGPQGFKGLIKLVIYLLASHEGHDADVSQPRRKTPKVDKALAGQREGASLRGRGFQLVNAREPESFSVAIGRAQFHDRHAVLLAGEETAAGVAPEAAF